MIIPAETAFKPFCAGIMRSDVREKRRNNLFRKCLKTFQS